jgi:hypothetical protein
LAVAESRCKRTEDVLGHQDRPHPSLRQIALVF